VERETERKDTKRYSTYKHIPTNNTFFDENNNKRKRENWINSLAELSAVSSEEVVIGESFDFRRFVISNEWNKLH